METGLSPIPQRHGPQGWHGCQDRHRIAQTQGQRWPRDPVEHIPDLCRDQDIQCGAAKVEQDIAWSGAVKIRGNASLPGAGAPRQQAQKARHAGGVARLDADSGVLGAPQLMPIEPVS